ncbi:MAG: hypothetical protein AVDCRST_MAG73-423, partial [uncultured Thermomicrobiales bacterium]
EPAPPPRRVHRADPAPPRRAVDVRPDRAAVPRRRWLADPGPARRRRRPAASGDDRRRRVPDRPRTDPGAVGWRGDAPRRRLARRRRGRLCRGLPVPGAGRGAGPRGAGPARLACRLRLRRPPLVRRRPGPDRRIGRGRPAPDRDRAGSGHPALVRRPGAVGAGRRRRGAGRGHGRDRRPGRRPVPDPRDAGADGRLRPDLDRLLGRKVSAGGPGAEGDRPRGAAAAGQPGGPDPGGLGRGAGNHDHRVAGQQLHRRHRDRHPLLRLARQRDGRRVLVSPDRRVRPRGLVRGFCHPGRVAGAERGRRGARHRPEQDVPGAGPLRLAQRGRPDQRPRRRRQRDRRRWDAGDRPHLVPAAAATPGPVLLHQRRGARPPRGEGVRRPRDRGGDAVGGRVQHGRHRLRPARRPTGAQRRRRLGLDRGPADRNQRRLRIGPVPAGPQQPDHRRRRQFSARGRDPDRPPGAGTLRLVLDPPHRRRHAGDGGPGQRPLRNATGVGQRGDAGAGGDGGGGRGGAV